MNVAYFYWPVAVANTVLQDCC